MKIQLLQEMENKFVSIPYEQCNQESDSVTLLEKLSETYITHLFGGRGENRIK